MATCRHLRGMKSRPVRVWRERKRRFSKWPLCYNCRGVHIFIQRLQLRRSRGAIPVRRCSSVTTRPTKPLRPHKACSTTRAMGNGLLGRGWADPLNRAASAASLQHPTIVLIVQPCRQLHQQHLTTGHRKISLADARPHRAGNGIVERQANTPSLSIGEMKVERPATVSNYPAIVAAAVWDRSENDCVPLAAALNCIKSVSAIQAVVLAGKFCCNAIFFAS